MKRSTNARVLEGRWQIDKSSPPLRGHSTVATGTARSKLESVCLNSDCQGVGKTQT